ncbi:MAG: TetR/AcrR family transcriptional regulator [Pseudomonadota bacterium]
MLNTCQMGKEKKPAVTQERGARTRERIEAAALAAFADRGYDGASTRQIADLAGVKQQLITYHYGSKLDLWKVVADRLFTGYREHQQARLAGLAGVDDVTTTRLLIRDYLEYCAHHPQLAKFMMHEGGVLTHRLRWLFERHTSRLIGTMQDQIAAARKLTGAPEVNMVQLGYVLIGASAMFSQEAEYQLLMGESANSEATIDSYSELLTSLILGG